MKMNKVFVIIVLSVFSVNLFVSGWPVSSSEEETTTETPENGTLNNTHKELFVVKVITYEIGILADVPDDDNATEDGPLTRQQVDLTFFDTQGNDTFLDFGDIPLPVQTNVSGQIVTGLAPVHIGTHNIEDTSGIVKAIPITGTIVNITESDTSFINLSRENVSLADQITHVNDTEGIAQLPILNDVLLPENFHETISNSLGASE